jgi:hypothetical protein
MKKTINILCSVMVVAIILAAVFTNLSGGVKESRFNFNQVHSSEIHASDINELVDNTAELVDNLDDNIAVNMETMGDDIEAWADDVEEWAETFEDDGPWYFQLFGWNGGIGSFSRHEVDQTQTMSIKQVNDIDIQTISSDVTVYPTNEEDIAVNFSGEYTGRNMEPKLTLARQGAKVTVDIEYGTRNWNIGSSNLKLDVYLPKDYMGIISLHTISGDITLSEWQFDTMEVKSVSGEIEINNVQTDELTFKTTSGNINVSAVVANSLNADTVSGDVELNQSMFKDVVVETTSGDVEISDVSGETDLRTVSGKINVDIIELTKEIKIKTTSGDAEIIVPSNAAFRVALKTTSGSLNSNVKMYYTSQDKHDIEGFTDENGPLIDIKTTSGDVQIREVE